MEKPPVFDVVFAAFGALDNMMIVPSRELGDLLASDRADAILLIP